MTVLITGITGFVGGYLANCLINNGTPEIYGTYLDKAVQLNNPGVHLHRMDITDADAVTRLLKELRPREIYHLAAIAATTGTNPTLYYRVNFNGTINLLEAVRQIVPDCRVLYVGSANIYGPVPEECQPIREDRELQPVNHYAAAKAAADLAARAYAANGLNVVRVRPFNHTGPVQSTAFVCSRLAMLMAEIMLGRREPVVEAGNLVAARDFTDVRDVVEAYRLLMQKGRSGEAYNVCSERAYSVREIIDILIQLAGLNVSIRSRADLMRSADIDVLRGSRGKITADTGWQPTIDFRQTLRELLFYWKHKLNIC